MSFLHCHTKNCHWSQDDFWSKDGYNPFRQDSVEYLKDYLFKDTVNMDIEYVRDMRMLGFECPAVEQENGTYDIKGTDFVAMELMRKARSISNMHVKTYDDWKKVKDNWKCPKCGESNWDID